MERVYAMKVIKTLIEGWQKKIASKGLVTMSDKHFKVVAERLKSVLSGIFGYHALLYSNEAKELVGEHLSVRKAVVLSNKLKCTNSQQVSDVICRYEELPIAPDCIDLVVLPGILQQSQFPHQILREVERVLIPEGHIVLLIANPVSWLSIKNRLIGYLSDKKEPLKLFGRLRINDWFRLLGFEITSEIPICTTNYHNQNNKGYSWIKKIALISCEYFASYYIIVAKKKVSTLIPIRPSWRSNRKLVTSRLNESSVQNQVENCVKQIKG